MSEPIPASASLILPDHPNLDHLRGQARERLRALRVNSSAATLAEAQRTIARDYGFTSWRALKAFVDQHGHRRNAPYAHLAGFYRHDPDTIANAVLGVSVRQDRLTLTTASGTRFELLPRDDGHFAIAGLAGSYSFESAPDKAASALISHLPGRALRLARVDRTTARAIRAAWQAAEIEQSRPRKEIAIDQAILRGYAGHYVSPFGAALAVECRDDRLLVELAGQPQFEVFAESETRFFFHVVPAQLSFVARDSRIVAVILHQQGLAQRFERVSTETAERSAAPIRERLAEQERPRTRVPIDPSLLAVYAGRYRLDPARIITVTCEADHLFVEIPGQRRFEVYPEAPNRFFWTVVAAQISFETRPDGSVSHAVLHQSGREIAVPRLYEEEIA